MRWSIAKMLILMTVAAIMFFVSSRYLTKNNAYIRTTVFGIYLSLLSIATALPFTSPPNWKRFWTTYALFGWMYLLFVLRIPDPHIDRVIPLWYNDQQNSVVGILLGFGCAFLSLILPGPVECQNDRDFKEPTIKS
jgi:hypothetical protein